MHFIREKEINMLGLPQKISLGFGGMLAIPGHALEVA
jgi:hypothetical protein